MKRIVGLLGWLGVALVVAALVIRLFFPNYSDWAKGLALAGLAVTALYTLSQWRDIARSFQGRQVRYGSLTAGSVVLVLVILVAVNMVSNGASWPVRVPGLSKRWDLTQSKQFSLSDQTKKILSELKSPVTIKVFYQSQQLPEYKDRLDEYANVSKLVTVQYIDAEKQPTQATANQVQQYGTVIFEYGGRSERTTSADEQDLTNALIKVVEGKVRKVYVVQGHGEHDPESSDQQTGYSGAKAKMKNDNFDVADLSLAVEGKIPDDASVVLIAGPKRDFDPKEIQALGDFLKKGGKVVLLVDPPESPTSPPITNLIAFAKDWGIKIGDDFVLDTHGVRGLEIPVANDYPPHAITNNFHYLTAFALARSVSPISGGTNGHVAQTIVETGRQSWAAADVKGLLATGKVDEPDTKKGDVMGPISLMAAVSAPVEGAAAAADAPKPETRVVVGGDSDFASNGLIQFQGNGDFFENVMNWAAQQENLIAIHPHTAADRPLTLTSDQARTLMWLVMFIIPGLLLLTAVYVWWRRR